jgi:hypothetical protein
MTDPTSAPEPLLDCPACDGAGAYLGTLGRLDWYACDDCGIHFNYLSDSTPTSAPVDPA